MENTQRRTEELEIAEKTIVEARLDRRKLTVEDWIRSIKGKKCGKVAAENDKRYVENCETTTRN